jgi:hypothetical protein
MEQLPELRRQLYFAEDWTFLVFFLCVLLIAWARFREPGQIRRIASGVFNVRLMRQQMREESQHRGAVVVYHLIYSSMLALLIQQAFREELSDTGDFVHHGLVFLVLMAAVLLSTLLLMQLTTVVSALAAGDFTLSEYRYSFSLINQFSGILVLPFILTASYFNGGVAEFALAGAAVMVSLLFLYRWGRGILHALRAGVPVFYIFFYICTLEFLPLCVAAKVLM